MDSLLSSLLQFERRLKTDETMRLTEEEMDGVVKRISESAQRRTGDRRKIGLVPVHTYVHQATKALIPGTSPCIAVPAFASHWGIVVGEGNHQKLFHLVFVDDMDGDGSSSAVENQKIRFHMWEPFKPPPDIKHVGNTHYSIEELEALGDAMIHEFGSYHKVFWNCQAFAKCYLRVVTGDIAAKFDDWTSADTSRLFLCAFLVGAPFATTNKFRENSRSEKLVKQIESIPANLSAAERSGRAIEAMYRHLRQDPSWGAEHGQLSDTTGTPAFLERVITLLFGKK